MNHIFPETRVFGLSDGEEIMTLAFFIFIQYRSVTDRQMDGQTNKTDGHSLSGYTSACIACYANALVTNDVLCIFTVTLHASYDGEITYIPLCVMQTITRSSAIAARPCDEKHAKDC